MGKPELSWQQIQEIQETNNPPLPESCPSDPSRESFDVQTNGEIIRIPNNLNDFKNWVRYKVFGILPDGQTSLLILGNLLDDLALQLKEALETPEKKADTEHQLSILVAKHMLVAVGTLAFLGVDLKQRITEAVKKKLYDKYNPVKIRKLVDSITGAATRRDDSDENRKILLRVLNNILNRLQGGDPNLQLIESLINALNDPNQNISSEDFKSNLERIIHKISLQLWKAIWNNKNGKKDNDEVEAPQISTVVQLLKTVGEWQNCNLPDEDRTLAIRAGRMAEEVEELKESLSVVASQINQIDENTLKNIKEEALDVIISGAGALATLPLLSPNELESLFFQASQSLREILSQLQPHNNITSS